MISILQSGVILQNRYQIVRLLGQGGFGAVYLARDTRLSNRGVAVKENFDVSMQAQAQFKIEADVLANLNHPNLPRVTDYFIEAGGRQYLVMDYIEGDDLETIVRRSGRLSEAQALPWIEQVCDALNYLHTQSRPIIHRDIKPTNIRVRSPDGRAMLVDFGIAKVFDPTQKTLTGARAVSPGYSPLEQYGKGTTDARSDVYALGATMYFVFTGVQPPEITDRVANIERLQSPRTQDPYLSPQIEQVVLKALEIGADMRFQTVNALRQALYVPVRLPSVSPRVLSQRLPIARLTSAAMTDKGLQCEHNEDNFLAQPLEADGGVFAVADGVSAHPAGEVASKIAIDKIYKNAVGQWATVKNTPVPENVRRVFTAWIKDANAKIFAVAQARGNSMGTTVTAALVVNGIVYPANVGDSRTYLFRSGQLYQLTRDHSLVASLVQAGNLKPEEVYTHPRRNEVFRALGQQKDVNVDVFDPNILGNEDRLVLCSDGLWEMVRQPQFEAILRGNPDPQTACATLIRAANANGGEGNITVVIVRVTF